MTSLETNILLVLADGRPRHGFGVLQAVWTGIGEMPLSGSLYYRLKVMEKAGLIRGEKSPEPRQARRYTITEEGRVALREELGRIEAVLSRAREKGIL